MTDEINFVRQWTLWELHDNFPIVQNAPLIIDPETGVTVDPASISLSYSWSTRRKWVLASAEVSGPRVDADGTYPDIPSVTCDFYDPVGGEPGGGKAPDWVLEIAERRMSQLPDPAPLPEGWSFSV